MFPQKSEQREEEEHETCTNLKSPPPYRRGLIMMSHQKLFPQKSEQREDEEHETRTNLKRPPLQEGSNIAVL